ncbi:MAG: hypothetical protein HY900_05325 [Deltaproteobacteria bacterium]|nr:hypothetical protein [Deltaproteobacteria bacterium]
MRPMLKGRIWLPAALLFLAPLASEAVDHRALIKGVYPDGPSVTAKCLECHPQAAAEVRGYLSPVPFGR